MNAIAKISTGLLIGASLFWGLIAQQASGEILFDQNYESDTLGAMPASWAYTGSGEWVIKSDRGNKVFQWSDGSSAPGMGSASLNAPYSLIPQGRALIVAYDIMVAQWPAQTNGTGGMLVAMGGGSGQEIQCGRYRILSLAADANTTWTFFAEDYLAQGGNAWNGTFNVSQWYNVKISIEPGEIGIDSLLHGKSRVFVDGALVSKQDFKINTGLTAAMLKITQQAQSQGIPGRKTVYIDNFKIYTVSLNGCQDGVDLSYTNVADINQDCRVNFHDFAVWCRWYLNCNGFESGCL